MTILIFCILMLLLYLDAVKKIDLLTGPMRFLYFLIVPHFPFIFYCCLISDLSLIPLIFPCPWAGSISSVFHDPNAFCALPQG